MKGMHMCANVITLLIKVLLTTEPMSTFIRNLPILPLLLLQPQLLLVKIQLLLKLPLKLLQLQYRLCRLLYRFCISFMDWVFVCATEKFLYVTFPHSFCTQLMVIKVLFEFFTLFPNIIFDHF